MRLADVSFSCDKLQPQPVVILGKPGNFCISTIYLFLAQPFLVSFLVPFYNHFSDKQ
jgi:hypothetical protein